MHKLHTLHLVYDTPPTATGGASMSEGVQVDPLERAVELGRRRRLVSELERAVEGSGPRVAALRAEIERLLAALDESETERASAIDLAVKNHGYYIETLIERDALRAEVERLRSMRWRWRR